MQLLYKRFVLYTLKKPRACHGYRADIYRDGWFSSRELQIIIGPAFVKQIIQIHQFL